MMTGAVDLDRVLVDELSVAADQSCAVASHLFGVVLVVQVVDDVVPALDRPVPAGGALGIVQQ
jgi:hypothetical protein